MLMNRWFGKEIPRPSVGWSKIH